MNPIELDQDAITDEEAAKEGRLIVEVFDAKGELAQRSVGPSSMELLAKHRAGQCDATCSWCHQALADKIGEEAAIATMYERCFGTPMPGATH